MRYIIVKEKIPRNNGMRSQGAFLLCQAEGKGALLTCRLPSAQYLASTAHLLMVEPILPHIYIILEQKQSSQESYRKMKNPQALIVSGLSSNSLNYFVLYKTGTGSKNLIEETFCFFPFYCILLLFILTQPQYARQSFLFLIDIRT